MPKAVLWVSYHGYSSLKEGAVALLEKNCMLVLGLTQDDVVQVVPSSCTVIDISSAGMCHFAMSQHK